jgi:hypothetical protein
LALALVLATLAVAAGAALGLAPSGTGRSLGALRWMALLAAITVVFAHLLPEAIHGIGALRALALFVLGLVVPIAIEWLFRSRRAAIGIELRHGLGLELGFWGLVVHHVGDGLVLGAYAHIEREPGGGYLDVALALVALTIPLVAVVVSAYARAEGRRAAAVRCVGLALAIAVGMFAAGKFGAGVAETFQNWISAAVSGLLLHVAAHDLGAVRWRSASVQRHGDR